MKIYINHLAAHVQIARLLHGEYISLNTIKLLYLPGSFFFVCECESVNVHVR